MHCFISRKLDYKEEIDWAENLLRFCACKVDRHSSFDSAVEIVTCFEDVCRVTEKIKTFLPNPLHPKQAIIEAYKLWHIIKFAHAFPIIIQHTKQKDAAFH